MKFLDRAGQVYGRLTAVRPEVTRRNGQIVWFCLCECGNTALVTGKRLVNGNTKSCGCLRRELQVIRNTAMKTHGMSHSPTYTTWVSMRQRCSNPLLKDWPNYGGRGITVCERWESFENFLADMGERPVGMTLDREDNEKGYEPNNCSWANGFEQANNRRDNHSVEYEGRTQTLSEWAAETGIGKQTLRHRIVAGWSAKEALTMKTNPCNGWIRGVRK